MLLSCVFVLAVLIHPMTTGQSTVFYGRHSAEDERNIRSSLDIAYDKFRKDIVTSLQQLWGVLADMEKANLGLPELKAIHDDFLATVHQFPKLWDKNNALVYRLVMNKSLCLTYAIQRGPAVPLFPDEKVTASYDSLSQLLVHLARDWASTGAATRERIYKHGVLAALERYSAANSRGGMSVLVPGAGLGRLAVEIAAMGFSVEANECSGTMVSALHSLLVDILPQYDLPHSPATSSAHDDPVQSRDHRSSPLTFFPYLNFHMMDEWDFDNRCKPALFPSDDAIHLAEWVRGGYSGRRQHGQGQIAVQYGDFLSSYGELSRKSSFDYVVTCFFIDTASNVLDYIYVIAHVLKPGGIWINAGPLHYHGRTKIPYAYRQIERVITAVGFEQQGPCIRLESTYCSEEDAFMKPDFYTFPLSVWRLVRKREDVLSTYYATRRNSSCCSFESNGSDSACYQPSVNYVLL